MMYANNFAAALLVDGKVVLREFEDKVFLPFGSEYKIRLKNLSSSRAKVNVYIDGTNVTENGLVIGGLQSLDLERFIKQGSLDKGNKFKFIERSEKIENHRGIGIEDGLVSIRYEFEMTVASAPFYPMRGIGSEYVTKGISSYATNSCSSVTASAANTGITVEGGISSQKFDTTYWGGSIGPTHVMNIRLLGDTGKGSQVTDPVTVKTKAKCKTCGTVNKATAKFCSECGTSLTIV